MQDLLSLTNLNAARIFFGPPVRTLDGLEAAHHLTMLNLTANELTNVSLLRALTNLATLNLYGNQLPLAAIVTARGPSR